MLMATKYVPQFGGYIVDVPQFYFRRGGDKKVFTSKHVTQCSLNPQVDFIEVRSGWSAYASANIPGQSTMDIQITLGDFMPEIFAAANAADFVNDPNFLVPVSESLTPDATTHKVTLTYKPAAGTVYINGLKEQASGTPVASGYYYVDTEAKTVLFSDDETDEMEIFYETADSTANVVNINNRDVACGEVILKWPIYNDGKKCEESGIIKYAVVRIFKTRVTTLPGFTFVKVLYAAMHTDTSLNGETLTAA